jgi:HPt (histidine-containing phosphotransfer) domain-containing protein
VTNTAPFDHTADLISETEAAMQALSIQADLTEAMGRFGDEKVYFKFLKKFMATFANAGNEIESLVQAGNTQDAAALIHNLKGVAGNLALKNVVFYAFQIEANLADIPETNDLCKKLQAAINEAGGVINGL